MGSGVHKIIALSCLSVCLQLSAFGQSEFDNANSLLRQLAQDRKNLAEEGDSEKAKVERERLAEKLKSVPAQVQQLLNKGILNALDTEAVSSAPTLQSKLRAALQVSEVEPGKNNDAYVFSLGSQQKPSYLVLYTISYCAVCGRSWLGVVGPKEDRYEVIAAVDDPLPNQSIDMIPLGTGAGDKPLFLLFGTIWGDAHRRLNATAYTVDGQQLKSVWSLPQLPEGRLEVSGRIIIVTSYTTLRPPFSLRTEVYAVTNNGIDLRSTSVRPAD